MTKLSKRLTAGAACAALTALACQGKNTEATAPMIMKEATPSAEPPPASMPAEAPATDEEAEAISDRSVAKPELRNEDGKFAARKRPDGGREGPARSWFPETFLFEPLVVTDDHGVASVQARVPDRLTTWRILALAHSRSGAQAGALTSFLGTLPVYVDPIVPKVLRVGDELALPLQLVNTTDQPITTTLTIEVAHAALRGTPASRTITLPANASRVELARIAATGAGEGALRVTLGDADAVLRTFTVAPLGRPVEVTRGGTLAAPRTLKLDGLAGATADTDRVTLVAFPGALAVLRAELGVALGRASLADDAYALLLAGRAAELLRSLGETADPDALRQLSILSAQRAVRHGRTLDVSRAALLAEAALAHPDNPVLQRLGERAAEYLARHQRPDGTFAGGNGWTLQRVLVATAEATRAVASSAATPAEARRAAAARVRAGGAFARNAAQVEDAYTAAAVLASGAVDGALADELKARVRAALRATDDGAKALVPDADIVRADGTRPTTEEATALAVLALQGDPPEILADLGATLLGSYAFALGWGDGRTNLVAMRAVVELFGNPIPDRVAVQLWRDGQLVTEGELTKDKRREVLTLDAPSPGLAAAHEWKIVAEPPVPGLGYALTLRGWTPWPKDAPNGGLELRIPTRLEGVVGAPIAIALSAAAPAGRALHIRHALPAGVQADRASLETLVAEGTLQRFELGDGAVDLFAAPLQPGLVLNVKYRVIPTLAGTLHSAASRMDAGGASLDLAPATWVIR
ncbi:MAG: alpha-2-macroglobulin family protein [Kofleriaceae bacterium]